MEHTAAENGMKKGNVISQDRLFNVRKEKVNCTQENLYFDINVATSVQCKLQSV